MRAEWRHRLRVAAKTARYWPELLVALEVVGGWTLLTWGLARLIARPEVWIFSAGLFLVSLAGLRFCGELFWTGLYALAKRKPTNG